MRNQRPRLVFRILVALFFVRAAVAAPERHVVVVVWDGMRPDFVSQQNTPTLWKLAQNGVDASLIKITDVSKN